MAAKCNTYVAIIDDDISACRALDRLLRASGMRAVMYASAEEFLEDDKRPAFDCLVADVRLIGATGVDLRQRLAAAGGPPVIFITADDDPATRERVGKLGAVASLRKTAPAQELLELIRNVSSRTVEA